MRTTAGTLRGVSRTPDEPSPETAAQLAKLGAQWRRSKEPLRRAVLAALANGDGSVRTIAKAAGISPQTVQKWKNEAS